MREEISEPQHWRARPSTNPSWSTRRRATTTPLPAELVDAAFDDEGSPAASRLDAAKIEVAIEVPVEVPVEVDAKTYPELIASLTNQLAQLETQRKQLQKLLAETNDCQS